jgi:hypothetical protein
MENYTINNDIEKLEKITNYFNTSLFSELENDALYLRHCFDKVKNNIELTNEERSKIYGIGQNMYDDLYSEIGASICHFVEIRDKLIEF